MNWTPVLVSAAAVAGAYHLLRRHSADGQTDLPEEPFPLPPGGVWAGLSGPNEDVELLALVVASEAADSPDDERGVAWTIRNRALKGGWFTSGVAGNSDWQKAMRKPNQYTVLRKPLSVLQAKLAARPRVQEIAAEVYAGSAPERNPVGNAIAYYPTWTRKPAWANNTALYRAVAQLPIGNGHYHRYYALASDALRTSDSLDLYDATDEAMDNPLKWAIPVAVGLTVYFLVK